MRALLIIGLTALAGCAEYVPPPGHTEAEIARCKSDVRWSQAGEVALIFVPIVGSAMGKGIPGNGDIDQCLAETKGRKDTAEWLRAVTGKN